MFRNTTLGLFETSIDTKGHQAVLLVCRRLAIALLGVILKLIIAKYGEASTVFKSPCRAAANIIVFVTVHEE